MNNNHRDGLAYELLKTELAQLESASNRYMVRTGVSSQQYDHYFRIAIEQDTADVAEKESTLADIIKSAFLAGHEVTEYLEQFRLFCSTDKV